MKKLLILVLMFTLGCATFKTAQEDPRNKDAIEESLKEDAKATAEEALKHPEVQEAIKDEAERQLQHKLDSIIKDNIVGPGK